MESIISFILKYETLTGAIIGAFLASIFGILAQALINKRKDKAEVERIVELVKNEMDLNFQLVRQMAMTKEAVYEFQTEYYDRFLDRIMLIKEESIKNRILSIYIKLKLYNSGINSKYGLIAKEIRELNKQAKWGLKIDTEEELTRNIIIYQEKKKSGDIIETELANYQGKDKRGYYGIICSINKLSARIK